MLLNPLSLVSVLYLVSFSQLIKALTVTNTATATPAKPHGFQSRSIDVRSQNVDDEFDSQAQTHLAYRQYQAQPQPHQQQQPLYDYSQSEEEQEELPRPAAYQGRQQQQSNYLTLNENKSDKKSSAAVSTSVETEEEEEEEVDRLSLLLSKSNFQCSGRNSGYYADESLQCEVFHYCQDNQKHSWICPEGFTFHQIHLICMPPSSENICQQSSKYHIVNDYLYKPLNLQEHQSKPNVTLRYSERYYPEHYYDHDRYSEEDDAPRPRIQQQQKQPIQVGFQETTPTPTSHQRAPAPQQPAPPQQQQVIRHQPQVGSQTPVYRRPAHSTTPQPQLQHGRPQASNLGVTSTPYRIFTAHPQLQHLQQQQQQVYRTPEEINISLQQRRPQYFLGSTTPRYYEDEYLYERK